MDNNLKISISETLEKDDNIIKIVIVGDSGVGKSNILSRFTQDDFNQESKPTVGVELSERTIKIEDKIIKIHIWDTAGQEKFKSITSAYYKGAKGAMIVYDISKRDSFNSIGKWYQEVREYGDKNLSVILVGNKSDLVLLRSVENEELIEKSKLLGIILLFIVGIPYMETSAANSSNIDESFQLLIKDVSIYINLRDY